MCILKSFVFLRKISLRKISQWHYIEIQNIRITDTRINTTNYDLIVLAEQGDGVFGAMLVVVVGSVRVKTLAEMLIFLIFAADFGKKCIFEIRSHIPYFDYLQEIKIVK